MNNVSRDIRKISNVYFLGKEWLLDVYIIKYDRDELIDEQDARSIIEKCLYQLELECLSDEFEYFKTGFAFLHFGRRGIDLSVWHIGKWGGTYEYFSCTWYCYGRDPQNMELLNSAEPKLSQYEVDLLRLELQENNNMLYGGLSGLQFREMFLKK